MKFCTDCKVEVLDDTDVCPLCNKALIEEPSKSTDTETVLHNCYPVIPQVWPKKKIATRRAIIAEGIVAILSVLLNIFIQPKIFWSVFVCWMLFYLFVCVYRSFLKHLEIAHEIFLQVILLSTTCVLADVIFGYTGWSINIAVPFILSIGLIALCSLAIFNRKDRPYFIWYQFWVALFGCVPFILYICGFPIYFVSAVIPLILSIMMLLGLMIFETTLFKQEIDRRFRF